MTSVSSAVLSQVFNIDNWAKFPLIDQRKKYPHITNELDIIFNDSNPDVCRADLHYNENAKNNSNGKRPVLVNIHGGGWIIGDKSNSTSYCLPIADSGFFVMNINYGMPEKDFPKLFEKVDPLRSHSPEYLWPYQIQTHFMALKWVEENAEKYNLDLDNVFVAGDSAGSHMSAVVAACFCSDECANALGVERPSYSPKGYVLNCGVYNFGFYNSLPIANVMEKKLMGRPDPKNSPLHSYINPTKFIDKKANNVLVLKGMIDIMTVLQGDFLVRHLKKVGVPYDFYKNNTFPNSFHDYMLLSPTKQAKKCMSYTVDWLWNKVDRA